MRLRARLFAVRHGLRPEPGPDGAPSVPNDLARPLAFYLACGYLPLGPRAVRLDRLERAAALSRASRERVRSSPLASCPRSWVARPRSCPPCSRPWATPRARAASSAARARPDMPRMGSPAERRKRASMTPWRP